MWNKLEEVFEELGLPYSRQGSYEEDEELPESFYTFWNYDSPVDGFYDDKANKKFWIWEIYFYTNNANLLYSGLDNFTEIAKQKGFVISDTGKDIGSDVPNYFGRHTRIQYIQNLEE